VHLHGYIDTPATTFLVLHEINILPWLFIAEGIKISQHFFLSSCTAGTWKKENRQFQAHQALQQDRILNFERRNNLPCPDFRVDQTRREIITVRLPPRAMRRRVTLSRSKFWKLASHPSISSREGAACKTARYDYHAGAILG